MLTELVQALVCLDSRVARQILADMMASGVDWSSLALPSTLDGPELSVAAAVVELVAARAHVPAPKWTQSVGASTEPVWLIRVEHRPRLKARLLEESPEPLRRRRVYAPEDFLTAA